jgi:hypothetical protein
VERIFWHENFEFCSIMNSWLGAAVWVMRPSPQEGWVEGVVLHYRCLEGSAFQFDIKVSLATTTTNTEGRESAAAEVEAEVIQITTQPVESELKKANNEIYLEFELVKRRDGENTSRVSIQDMTSLTHLNEPEMIRCLEERYFSSQVYTATGPILIAINPYRALDIYGEETLSKYINSENSKGADNEPHIFQISDNAYRKMLGDKFDPETRENQSILVNGESGAGKTESTKHCLHYLAVISSTIASRLGLDSDSGNIENQIIASNPITESFGNAKTSRNNNSSRFGKFIELGYTADGIIENGSIRTYLLETVRVNTHVEGERGFHIFYELAAHSPEMVSSKGIHSLCDFNVTNGTMSSRNSITSALERQVDAENYDTLLTALHTMGVDPVDQELIEDLIISILHIGNLTFVTSEVPGEDDAIFSSEAMASHVPFICELLGITAESLIHAIGRRSLTVGTVTTVKNLSVVDVMNAKDNLTKTLYSALFGWVLEFFENNSLEQLCINYTNEKLQVLHPPSPSVHSPHPPPSSNSLTLTGPLQHHHLQVGAGALPDGRHHDQVRWLSRQLPQDRAAGELQDRHLRSVQREAEAARTGLLPQPGARSLCQLRSEPILRGDQAAQEQVPVPGQTLRRRRGVQLGAPDREEQERGGAGVPRLPPELESHLPSEPDFLLGP